jgi:hypothetical protein
MTILLFFRRLLRVLKWGLLFEGRRGLTTTGHSPSSGGDSTVHTHTHTTHSTHTHTHYSLYSLTPAAHSLTLLTPSTFLSLKIEYLIRHGPQERHRVQQFFYCCVCIRCRGNMFTQQLPSNIRGEHRQRARWSHKRPFNFSKQGNYAKNDVCESKNLETLNVRSHHEK